MKIVVPDYVATLTKEESALTLPEKEQEVSITFDQEIQEILKLPKMPSKYIVEQSDYGNHNFKLQVLLKFIELCQEEIIPRHNKAIETIQSRSDTLQGQMLHQQKGIVHLRVQVEELHKNMERLEASRTLAQSKQDDLNIRLKDTLKNLKDSCKNNTVAERKMAEDLVNIKKETDNLNVRLTDATSKMNYYTTQVKTQTAIVKKNLKPLHLDNNRARFIKTNLNTMTKNIEELIHKVKTLKTQVTELTEPKHSQYFSKTM